MLVRAPFGKIRKIGPNNRAVGMKDMRAVTMDEDAALIAIVESIAPDVPPAFNYANSFPRRRHSFGKRRAGKPGARHYPIDCHNYPTSISRREAATNLLIKA